MNNTLPRGLEEFVQEQVASGLYKSSSEVHCEALRPLKHRLDLAEKLSSLRAAVNEGVLQADRGEARACTPADIVELAKARKAGP
jgi:putative addiction module CopG family antidote